MIANNILIGFRNSLSQGTVMKILAAAAAIAALIIGTQCAFAQAPADEITLIGGCAWRDQVEVLEGEPQAKLSFRWQDCDGKEAPEVRFTLDSNNTLIQSWDGSNVPVAQFWPLSGKAPHVLVETVASPSISEAEKGRCRVRLDFVTHHYSYEPDARYMEELLARNEPFHACGTFGETNDGIQYFSVIDNKLLAYFWVGQETPLFDPASFKLVPQAAQQ
jgi:hypothetical protein